MGKGGPWILAASEIIGNAMQYNKQHRKNVELSFLTVSAESEVATCCFRIRPCRRVRLAELLECRVHMHCCQHPETAGGAAARRQLCKSPTELRLPNQTSYE